MRANAESCEISRAAAAMPTTSLTFSPVSRAVFWYTRMQAHTVPSCSRRSVADQTHSAAILHEFARFPCLSGVLQRILAVSERLSAVQNHGTHVWGYDEKG